MNRLHVHVSVDDLEASTKFYQALFGLEPTARSEECVEWLLDDPALDFAISRRTGSEPVLARLGLQLDGPQELSQLRERLTAAGMGDMSNTAPEDGVDKLWVVDPVDVLWEAYDRQGPRVAGGPSYADVVAAKRRRDVAERPIPLVRALRTQRRNTPYTSRPYAAIG